MKIIESRIPRFGAHPRAPRSCSFMQLQEGRGLVVETGSPQRIDAQAKHPEVTFCSFKNSVKFQRFSGVPAGGCANDNGRVMGAPGTCRGGAVAGAGNGWCMVTIRALAGLGPAQE